MSADVRAVHTAVRVPDHPAPYDTAHLKVFYPAAPTGDMSERMTGQVTADASRAPYPVVVIAPGINVTPDSYRWLAVELVQRGYAVVTYSLVTEVFGAGVSISPGLDATKVQPDSYGSAPSGNAFQVILDSVAALNTQPPLAGLLDLDRVAFGGHSGGGSAVLTSASREWFPALRAVFSYGAHGMASMPLGWPAGTVLRLPETPVLLMTGEVDGVMAASAVRYGEESDTGRVDPVARTFDSAYEGGRGDVLHAVLTGANHFSITYPLDETSARSFLDEPATGDEVAVRATIADLTATFLDAFVRDDDAARDVLAKWAEQAPDGITTLRRK